MDPSFVAEAIAEACEIYDVQRIAYDRWCIEDLKRELDRMGAQPPLTYCASNAVIEADPAGNRKLAKNKSSGRIDGLVALAMALAVIDCEPENEMPACLAELMGD